MLKIELWNQIDTWIEAFKTESTIKEVNDFLRLCFKDSTNWTISLNIITWGKTKTMEVSFNHTLY